MNVKVKVALTGGELASHRDSSHPVGRLFADASVFQLSTLNFQLRIVTAKYANGREAEHPIPGRLTTKHTKRHERKTRGAARLGRRFAPSSWLLEVCYWTGKRRRAEERKSRNADIPKYRKLSRSDV